MPSLCTLQVTCCYTFSFDLQMSKSPNLYFFNFLPAAIEIFISLVGIYTGLTL